MIGGDLKAACARHFQSIITHIYILFHYLHLPLLLALPAFYSSEATSIFVVNESIRPVYRQWLSTVSVPQPLPESLLNIEEAWSVYLNSRVEEWKVLFTFACALVATSLTFFQIPHATSVPTTHFLASLAVCRALSGLVYSPIFPLFFRSQMTRSIHFIMLWPHERIPTFWSPWTMLSLPAATIIWALVFFILAALNFLCQTAGPEGTAPSLMPAHLMLVLRGIVTISTLLDFVGLCWIWTLMGRYRRICSAKMRLREESVRIQEILANSV